MPLIFIFMPPGGLQIAPPEIGYRSRSVASAGIVYLRVPLQSHDPIRSIQLQILLKESKPRVAEGACRKSAGLVSWYYYYDTRERGSALLRGRQQLRRLPNQQPSPNSVSPSLGTRMPGAWSAEADVEGSLGPVGGG